ncbi:MAG: OmpA family protein [Bacteroidales bacterium]|nr:OmpA family protein [Bacteroidales bacterium]
MNTRRLLLLLLVPIFRLNCYSQNLIANGSFEDANTCTESDAECSPEAWKTTSPFLLVYGGEKSNKSVGFTVFNTSIPETRIYMQIKLLCPLTKDKLYRFSIKVKPGGAQIESIGVLFSDSILFYDRAELIKIKPSIDLNISKAKRTKRNRGDWNKIDVDYRAKGNEKYLIIGSFQADSEQKRTFFSPPKDFTNYAYVVDDVELIPIDKIDLCPDYETTREKLYSLNDRHPLKRYNLFGDDEYPIKETEKNLDFDTIRIGSVFFEFDSYKIDSVGKISLDSLFSNLSKENIDFIKIHGHTDSIGNKDYNLELSLNRANAIKEMLIAHGLTDWISETKGFGDNFPIESNATEEGRKKNRRVEVIIKYKNKSAANTDNKGKLLVTIFANRSCTQDRFVIGDKPGPRH